MTCRKSLVRIARCLAVTVAIVLGLAATASAGAREYETGTSGGTYWLCVDGISTAEKDSLKGVNPNTSSEIHADGTWLVCWDNLSLSQLIGLRQAVQGLTPAIPERGWTASMSDNYDPNGPHHLTLYGTGTRPTPGTPWSVTVTIDGDPATQSCSSSSTSCTRLSRSS